MWPGGREGEWEGEWEGGDKELRNHRPLKCADARDCQGSMSLTRHSSGADSPMKYHKAEKKRKFCTFLTCLTSVQL